MGFNARLMKREDESQFDGRLMKRMYDQSNNFDSRLMKRMGESNYDKRIMKREEESNSNTRLMESRFYTSIFFPHPVNREYFDAYNVRSPRMKDRKLLTKAESYAPISDEKRKRSLSDYSKRLMRNVEWNMPIV